MTTRLEQGLTFLRSGYLFASRIRQKAGVAATSHAPVTLTMLGKTSHLVRGAEGVRLFYDSTRIKRDGAMPKFIQVPLFGNGAVHTLDGEEHQVRKKAMADLAYDDARVADFTDLVGDELENTHRRWIADGGTVHEDTAVAFGRAAFRWAGIPLSDEEMDRRARQMNRLLDTFGRLRTNPVAAFERRRLNKWATGLIEQVRAGDIEAPADSVLAHMADLRGIDGERVDAAVAGVELQNLTRPTVAVGRFAAFAATALVEHPEWAERIRAAAGDRLTDVPEAVAFAQEVRRTHPFVPMLPGLLTQDTELSGCPMKKGQRVLLDFPQDARIGLFQIDQAAEHVDLERRLKTDQHRTGAVRGQMRENQGDGLRPFGSQEASEFVGFGFLQEPERSVVAGPGRLGCRGIGGVV